MLTALRIAATTFMQAIYDIGWSGAESSQLIWEEQTQNWEDLEG